MRMRNVVGLALVLSSSFATSLNAGVAVTERCKEDQLGSGADLKGRNAWARKCGYIKALTEEAFNEEGNYVVFTTGRKGGVPNIPVTEGEACITGLVKLGTCQAGCYTPGQELLFQDRYLGIKEAFDQGESSVDALTQDSSLASPKLAATALKAYVSGDAEEEIYTLETQDARTIEVTKEHPMVLADGRLVAARTLKKGDLLATADGSPVELVNVSHHPYVGKVWNVKPSSVARKANILVVNGLLTGSVRFQNEWANDAYRLSQRDGE